MRLIILGIFFIFIFECDSTKELNKLNLVQINLSNIAYKQLSSTKANILSAPPLAILNVSLLSKYQCYRNIRTNLWSLGLPVIFWNDKYMENIKKSINKNNPLKKFSNNETFILPPSGIRAYRLNWRRKLNNDNDNKILLDSSWYNAKTDFVLPMWHTFVMEIISGNDSESKCAEIKSALLNESLQTSELSVDFLRGEMKELSAKNIEIKINDLKSVKEFKNSNCEGKGECFVSKEYAEMWAYEVSAKVMTSINGSNLYLQKLMFDHVFEYLCKEKVSIDSVSVVKLKNHNENGLACKIPYKIRRTCESYSSCRDEKEITFNVNNKIIYDDNIQLSVPISVI